ncbi:hypothetical protein [Rhodopila sp.]|uniref:hypothetical protein n=1 Tax=Rhodopila sp. TaxID=2480087 RepID=UPI003D139EA6
MSDILRRMQRNPALPEHLRQPEGWPAEIRAEWAGDQGTASTSRHRAALLGRMNKTRAALDAFKPEFILIWGDDQYENFRADIIPAYCISAFDGFNFSPPAANVWGETDKLRHGDYQAWRQYPGASVEDSGQQEILNWMCLVVALHALERRPKDLGFVDTWIFNSSKTFLVAPP